ncbi:MAG: WD40/YVTN/BNR-like repeat-containing protein, partial [Thermoanaerobaculia bacterium]
WTRVVPTTVKGGCLDLAFRGDTAGDFLFASCGVFEQATVYRTKNGEGSAAWTPVLSDPGMSRTSLAIAPSNPSIIYALAASNLTGPQNTNQNLHAVFRSDRDGDPGSWTTQVRYDDPVKLNRILLTNAQPAIDPQCQGRSDSATGNWVPMGWHCNVIAVDPTNPDRIWAAGVDLFRSEDRGKTWGEASFWWIDPQRSSFVHADQHRIVFDPRYDGVTNQTMYVSNDGGIYRTDNANAPIVNGTLSACDPEGSKVVFQSLNRELGVTQFYHGAVFADGKRFLGGAQDNGTLLGSVNDGIDGWLHEWGGDGGFVAIDPADPATIYFESQNAAIVRFTGSSVADATTNLDGNDNFLFITPFVIDPAKTSRLWIGGTKLWRTENRGVSWTVASTQLQGQLSAVAVGTQHAKRVLAGTSLGDIVRNDNAPAATLATQWNASHPRDGFVSSITFDPTNDDVAYATYAGFGGGAHVWRTTDGGATWSPRDGSGDGALPDIPAHSVAIDPTLPSRLYL